MIDVVIVDDNPAVRAGLGRFLDGEPGLRVVGSCADGAEVTGVVARACPQVVVLDLGLPLMDGYQVAERIRASWPEVALVALSGQVLGRSVIRARDAGFTGYVEKSQPPAELAAAVRAAAAGRHAWSERALQALAVADPG